MEIVFAVLTFFVVFFIGRVFSYRRKSINHAIDALKKTVDSLPDESTPSPRVIKSKLALKYYELSHRVDSNDIRDYAKTMFGVIQPKPEHIAMLMLSSLSHDFKREHASSNFAPYADISRWCEQAEHYLVDQEKLNS